jgi:hypothetical protein
MMPELLILFQVLISTRENLRCRKNRYTTSRRIRSPHAEAYNRTSSQLSRLMPQQPSTVVTSTAAPTPVHNTEVMEHNEDLFVRIQNSCWQSNASLKHLIIAPQNRKNALKLKHILSDRVNRERGRVIRHNAINKSHTFEQPSARTCSLSIW